mmetsp:Transcript_57462/g.101541  ORF Transcript_57462/g.101541 Transcript_57462/m.101541 type:complete len:153 (-) Transcript_57462:116-574(-)
MLLGALASVLASTNAMNLVGRSSGSSVRVVDYRVPRTLLRLRGGVHTLVDMDDWAAVQESAENKLIVLDFTASWCGPCQRIAPAFEALAAETANAIFVKCDVDELGELAAELGVTSMPTFLLFRSGEIVGSLRGANEEALRSLVAEHLPVLA